MSKSIEQDSQMSGEAAGRDEHAPQSQKSNFNTLAIRARCAQTPEKEHANPLFLTSSFTFENSEEARALFAEEMEGNIYSRYSNPNTDEFAYKLALLEKAEDGLSTATGMAAVFLSLITCVHAGEHIIASRAVFGSTHQILTKILPRWNISFTYVDINRPQDWGMAVQPNSKLLFLETPSNPGLDLVDLEWASEFAKAHKLTLAVDNCFATPYLQQPIPLGADLIIHSATKFIDGQGRVLGGAVLGRQDLIEESRFLAKHTGPTLSAFNAWLLSRSLETLAVRMDRHCKQAQELATCLQEHPEVLWVRYPFLESHPQHAIACKQMRQGGGLFTFELEGGLERCVRFMDSLQMLSRSPNLGDTRTIATHPAYTTHSRLTPEERAAVGIGDALIRISVGLEDMEDIYADIEQAIDASR